MIEDLQNDFERAQALQNMLISRATGGSAIDFEYEELRRYFLDEVQTKTLMPSFVRTNRNLDQFWGFIKYEYDSYAKRKNFIWSEFTKLLDYLEGKTPAPADDNISDGLKDFNEESVHSVWSKALSRRESDPEGAITSARTLLETVCKHILDSKGIQYNAGKVDLHELYKLTAKELNLSPEQHSEQIFKQILGGCSGIVSGLGSIRNKFGDAHGQGKRSIKPAPRHAELAVNLSGSMTLFIVSTWKEFNKN